jgi:acyl-CoA thioesterase FadM
MNGATVYQGLVQRSQVDAAGAMDAQGAAMALLDAFHIGLALSGPPASGASPAGDDPRLDADTLSLRRLDGPAPTIGEVVRCQLETPSPGEAGQAFQAVLAGPRGPAWAATVRYDPARAGRRPIDAAAATATAADLPPALVWQRLRAEHCDQAGHVNVQVFLALADDAIGVLCQQAAPYGHRLHSTRVRVNFKSELFAGDVVSVHSGIRHVDPAGIDLVHGIVHRPSGRLACVIETRLAALDAAGAPVGHGWDAAVLQALAPQDWPALPRPRAPGLPQAPGEPAATAVPTCLAVVDAWDADAAGWLQTRALMNLCSTGARQYLAQIGLDAARLSADQMTVAAVDYAIDIRRRPRLGCNLTLVSSPLSVSAKSIRFAHHLVESQRRTVYATVEIVGVMLDLATHRSAEVPADVRLRLDSAGGPPASA